MATLNARDILVQESPPGADYAVILVKGSIYAIWEDGRVWNLKLGKSLSFDIDKDGYRTAHVGGHSIKLHRLVLIVFDREPTYGEQARHLDGNPAHNWASNLCWGTGGENWQDRREHGRAYKLTIEQVKEIRSSSLTVGELAKLYGVSQPNISNIIRRIIWRSIP